MKNKLLLITVALALPAMAGTATYQSTSSPAPQPSSSLWSWFIGGSAGYLVDSEEGFYTGHLGLDTPWDVGGCNIALYAEVGYAQIDDSFYAGLVPVDADTDVIPITLNVKFERPLVGNLSGYVGGGLGAAIFSTDVTSPILPGKLSSDETVFTASVFAGLVYNVTSAFELYGGARWMYVDDSDVRGFGTDGSSSSDDWLFEIGLRFNLGPPTN